MLYRFYGVDLKEYCDDCECFRDGCCTDGGESYLEDGCRIEVCYKVLSWLKRDGEVVYSDFDDEYVYREDCVYTRDWGYVLESSAREYFRECVNCGDLVHYDSFDEEEQLCSYCLEECGTIRAYHDHKQEFEPLVRAPYYFGGEIEVESRGSTSCKAMARKLDSEYWKYLVFERDSSLWNGFEIITQPLSAEQWNDNDQFDLNGVCSMLRSHGFETLNSCGLHIHVSRSIFGDDSLSQELALYRLIRFYNLHYDTFVALSRRSEDKALEWAEPDVVYTERDFCDFVATTLSEKRRERYRAVNTTPYETVEFRLANGTLEPDTIRAWIDLHHALCLNSRREELDYDDFDAWLDGISDSTRSYINQYL